MKLVVAAAPALPPSFRPAPAHALTGTRVTIRGHLGLITHAEGRRAYVRLDTDTAGWFLLAELELGQ